MMMNDEILGVFVPVVAYWVYGCILDLFAEIFPSHRNRSKGEEMMQNRLTSKHVVILGVLLQQVLQVVAATILYALTSRTEPAATGPDDEVSRFITVAIPALQFLVAMLVMDVWQYFIHRSMHENKYLYKYIHSYHHRIEAPYAYAALYNHPLEGVLVDTLGGAISFLISGMSVRTSIYFFTFATLKAVDDHSGLHLPWHPFHLIFRNNSRYHDIHHRYPTFNFSQPFFIVWDMVFDTRYE